MKTKAWAWLVVVLLVSLFVGPLYAAASHKIALKLRPFPITDSRFYIQGVIDGRSDRSDLGEIQIWSHYQEPLILEGDLRTDLQALADISFKKTTDKIPVVMKVNLLRFSSWSGLNRYIKVEAQIAFYRVQDGKLGKVYQTEAYLEQAESGLDQYERMLRSVIGKCLTGFAATSWESVAPEWQDYQTVVAQTTPSDATLSLTMPERHRIYLLESISVPGGNGGGLLRYDQDVNQKDWAWVDNSATEIFSAKNGTNSGMVYNLESRSGVMRRLGDSGFAILVEWGMPFGVESLPDYSRIIYGLNLQESLVYFPLEKHGLAATASFYQIRLFNSDIYPQDSGFRIGIGYQF
ncbi:MAG TPA: hypothetical protein VF531_12610 [Bacillota bacterium]